MIKGKNRSYQPLNFALILIAGIFIGMIIHKTPRQESLFLMPRSDKFNTVMQYIKEEYVDSVNPSKLTEDALMAMLKELDPHSVYIPASELQAVNEPIEGGFFGIGVQFNMQNDTAVIINTIPNGPSAKLGLAAGDRIVRVNDSIVAGIKLSSDKIVKKLKGPRGTIVKVGIFRPGRKKELSFTITRDRIPLYSVDASYMIEKNIGFIKISQFSKTTSKEFIEAVTELHKKGMKKLIIDLRGNGGGLLDAAIKVADQFLDANKLIVYTQGRTKPRENYYATSDGVCQNDSVIILIDELTASASEILAGAIQDNDRGKIIGRRSFGKGLVQDQTVFTDGSGLRLTIARYYTPTGRCIQKPYNKGIDDYYRDLSNRIEHGEMESKDSIHFKDTTKYITGKGKVLYGGGGIMPDVFIPYDTTAFSPYYAAVRDLGLIYRFSFEYSDGNRKKLKNFKKWQDLDKYLQSQKLLPSFIQYAAKSQIQKRDKDLKKSGQIIEIQIRANIVRNYFNDAGFYQVIQKIDNVLQRGTAILAKE